MKPTNELFRFTVKSQNSISYNKEEDDVQYSDFR